MLREFIKTLHKSTKRNYIHRMVNEKAKCMKIAKNFSKSYWDGSKKYGYGGYKYIEGRWSKLALDLIKCYRLNNDSNILDIGCGKGYLLFEIKKILPNVRIFGIDISQYAIKNSKIEIRENIFIHDIKNKTKFSDHYFDLSISLNCLHNLQIFNLKKAIDEINRISKNSYIVVESYRNEKELFNLQCWALTCESFFDVDEWQWMFKKLNYKGDHEFIFFE